MRTSKRITAAVATLASAAALQPGVAAGDYELRRDGSKAVPVSVPPTTTPSRGDAFDWGDAGVGAGVLAVALAAAGTAVLTIRRRSVAAPAIRSQVTGS
jgi:hypothetical protein